MNSNESRRYFLKVFGSSFVGLPFLEYFNVPAYGASAPMRYLIMHAGCSLGRDTQTHMVNPSKTGLGYDLPPGLSVLKDPTMGKSLFGPAFKGDPALISLISNLSIPMVSNPNNQKCELSQYFHSAPLTCTHAAETGLLNNGSLKFAGTTWDNIIHPLVSASGQPLVNTRV